MARRLAAIMAADMVGFSRLMAADENGTIERQKALRASFMDPIILNFGGRIVKTTGDGLLVEFPSVVDAVECAVEIQRNLPERERTLPEDQRIRYRIGINLGDIVIDGDDIYGNGVRVDAPHPHGHVGAHQEPGRSRRYLCFWQSLRSSREGCWCWVFLPRSAELQEYRPSGECLQSAARSHRRRSDRWPA